eukprot:15456010-Alexandrium_andersonii.AAC.2
MEDDEEDTETKPNYAEVRRKLVAARDALEPSADKSIVDMLNAKIEAIPSGDKLSAKNTYLEAQKLYDRRKQHADAKSAAAKKLTKALEAARREEDEAKQDLKHSEDMLKMAIQALPTPAQGEETLIEATEAQDSKDKPDPFIELSQALAGESQGDDPEVADLARRTLGAQAGEANKVEAVAKALRSLREALRAPLPPVGTPQRAAAASGQDERRRPSRSRSPERRNG